MSNIVSKLLSGNLFHGNAITKNSFAARVKRARSKTSLENLMLAAHVGCSNPKTIRRRIALVSGKIG